MLDSKMFFEKFDFLSERLEKRGEKKENLEKIRDKLKRKNFLIKSLNDFKRKKKKLSKRDFCVSDFLFEEKKRVQKM